MFKPIFALLIASAAIGSAFPPATAQSVISAEADKQALPDLRPATGENDIAEAWLIAPTTRYAHFVQGSRYEAGGFRVRMADGQVLTLMLDEDHVFEDRQPRLADLDDDGHDEIVLVLTQLDKGASLAVFSVVNGAVTLKAQTPYIGQPFRWLNPAGIADFDGDGQLDIAFVAMPHLAKRLEIWTLENGKLKRIGDADGFSNHRNGSIYTGMSAIADFNDDGIMDMALPSGDRRSIRFVSFANRQWTDIATRKLPLAVDGPFSLSAQNPPAISVGLEGGEAAIVAP